MDNLCESPTCLEHLKVQREDGSARKGAFIFMAFSDLKFDVVRSAVCF